MPRFSSFANVHIVMVKNCERSRVLVLDMSLSTILTMLRARKQQIVRIFKSQRFPTLRKLMSSTRTFKFNCGYSLCTSHQTDDPRATQHRLDGLQRFRHASSSFCDAEHHHAIFLQLFVIIGALAKSTRTSAAPSPRGCCTSPRPARVSNAMRSAPPL